MSLASALYVGWVAHTRMRPRPHAFRYRSYWLLVDLDELPKLARRLRVFSHNRWNLFSFHDADHGSGSGRNLRAELDLQLRDAGIDLDGGAIRILCMPRVLGFVFNPISIHFCHDRDDALRAIRYEVHNTFRQRHSYLIAVPRAATPKGAIQQHCRKRFYVSPFMDLGMAYRFSVKPPAGDVGVVIRGDDPAGPLIVASLGGARRDLTDRALLRLFVTLPLLTLKVVAAIHWQALRLWLKGVPLVARPHPPAEPVTTPQTAIEAGSPNAHKTEGIAVAK